MYRQIFKPTEYDRAIPVVIPREWQGQSIEIIAFPVSSLSETPPAAAAADDDAAAAAADDDFYKLCGAWESDQSAEEMAAELKASRNFREKNAAF